MLEPRRTSVTRPSTGVGNLAVAYRGLPLTATDMDSSRLAWDMGRAAGSAAGKTWPLGSAGL